MGWDNGYRSLWRTLEKLDSVRTDRFCWTEGIKSLQKLTAKFKNGKKIGTLSYDTIQNNLLDFRSEGLITLHFQNDEGDYRGVFGFYVAGQDLHDALCKRVGRMCQYVGWDNLPPPIIPDGRHYDDKLSNANEKDMESARAEAVLNIPRQSLSDSSATHTELEKVTQPVTPLVTPDLEKVTQPVTPLVTPDLEKVTPTETQSVTPLFEESNPNGNPIEAPQGAHNDTVTPPAPKFGLRFGAPNHVIMESSQSLEAIIQSSESAKAGSQGKPEESQNLKAGSDLNLSMTDQNQKQNRSHVLTDQPRRMPTILDHFGYTVAIDDISDGEIDQAKLDKYSLRDQMKGMRECCQEVKDSMDRLPYLGRKTNGDIMAKAMVLWTEKNHERVDKYWYRVAKTLRQGGPSVLKPETEWHAPALSTVFVRAAEETGFDLTPYVDQFQWPDVNSYRDGWQRLSQLSETWLTETGIIKLRDWLWENDAMPDKPASPPWS